MDTTGQLWASHWHVGRFGEIYRFGAIALLAGLLVQLLGDAVIATVDVVSAKSSWNGCWLRLSYRGKGRRSQGSNFSTEMGDGSQRSLSEPRVVVVSDLCVEKRWTRARREMELGGNIGQGRQLAINALLTTQGLPGSISNEYDVTNYCNGPSYIVQTIVRGGTPNTHGNQYSVCRVTLLPRKLWAVLSNTWREIEREGDSHNERKPRFARLDDDQQHGEVEGEREPETAVSRSALETRPQQKYMPQYWMDRGEKMIAGLAVQLCEGRGLLGRRPWLSKLPDFRMQMSLCTSDGLRALMLSHSLTTRDDERGGVGDRVAATSDC